MKNSTVLVLTSLIAALAFIGFTVFKIDITVPGGKSAFHFANAFVVIGALVLGPIRGGLAGAIGLTIADIVSGYVLYAPTTFILKFGIAVCSSVVAHKFFSVNEITIRKKQTTVVFLSAFSGMLFNIIFDPLVSFVRSYILLSAGITEVSGHAIKKATLASVIAKMSAFTTTINALLTIIIVTVSYFYVYNALKGIYLYKKN